MTLKLNSFILFLFLPLFLFAQQVPQGISYQAIARDKKGNLLTNSQIDILFSIIDGKINGNVLYQEQHLTTSNNQGLFTLIIGKGASVQGLFDKIPWANGNIKFLRIELGKANDAQLTLLGTTQLFSVPYALVAQKSIQKPDSLSLNDLIDVKNTQPQPSDALVYDGKKWTNKQIKPKPYFEGKNITIKNDTISASSANPISITGSGGTNVTNNGSNFNINSPKYKQGNGITIKNDTISALNPTPISIIGSGGTNVTSNGSNFNVNSTKYKQGNGIAIQNDTIVNTGDLSNTNEIQTLSISNNTVSLSKGGGTVNLPNTTYNAGSGISISNNTISAIDNSSSNEIQELSISGNSLSISNGNTVQLPSSGSSGGGGDPFGPTAQHPLGLRGTIVSAQTTATYQLLAGKIAYVYPGNMQLYSYFKGPITINMAQINGIELIVFDQNPTIEIINTTSFTQYTVPMGKFFYGRADCGAIIGPLISEGTVIMPTNFCNGGVFNLNGYLINK